MKGYTYAAVAVAVLALLCWAGYSAISYVNGVDERAYKRGVAETDAAYKARDNSQLQSVLKERDELAAKVREREETHDTEIGMMEEAHAHEVFQIEQQRDAALARSRVWRDPGKTGACPTGGDRGTATASPADPGGGAGPVGGAELSEITRRFLFAEAERADKIVAKLRLCRETLVIERR